MKKDDIHLWDIHRIFIGEAPNEFMIEVVIRTVLIYLVLLVIVRLMGKRMSGQLSIAEMSVMLMLGAIVSPAMQIPQVGLVQGALILILALIFQRGFNFFEFKSSKLEKLNHGEIVMLVKDGTLMLEELDKAKLTRQQLFAALRSEGIFNLGQVERVYLEVFGMFSIYQAKQPKPGLSIFPPDDQEVISILKEDDKHELVCKSCGHVKSKIEHHQECPICVSREWMEASVSVIS